MKVIHSLPGRLRIELPGLSNNPGLASLLEGSLTLAKGIIRARAGCSSGRLLVVYAPDILSQAQVKKQISKILALEKCRPGPARKIGRQNKGSASEMRPYELEHLPLARQFFLTAASGFLLLYVFLKPKMKIPKQGAGVKELSNLETVLTILTGYPIFKTALDHLWQKGRLTSELLAGTASITSLAIQESRLGLFIVWLTYLSTLLRTLSQEHARDRIRVMLQGKRPVARLKTPAGEIIVPGGQVACGSLILVRKGERVPVDGPILRGAGLVDMCPVKGGPEPVVSGEGDTVYAGSLLLEGELHIKAARVGKNTYVSRVIQLLEKGEPLHSPHSMQTVRLMNRLSYLSLAVSAGIFLATRDAKLAVATLVAGTPGAAGLANSMAFGAGAGAAARQGILLKAGRHIEDMAGADTILFGRSTLLSKKNNLDLEALSMLRRTGVPHIGLLTAESPEEIGAAAARLKLKDTWPQCRPREKAAIISRLRRRGRVVAVVVEENSDAPALSAANIGITMARAGDLDLGSANVIIAADDPRKVAVFRVLARQGLSAARQNAAVSVGANLLGLAFGISGSLSPLTMALLQNFSTLAILLNSGRLLIPVQMEKVKQPAVCKEAAATLDACASPAAQRLAVFPPAIELKRFRAGTIGKGQRPKSALSSGDRHIIQESLQLNAGVEAVLITGDHKDTALAIARETGIVQGGDNIAMIPEAIKEGRAVYDNIRKCVRYLTTTNIGDGVVILVASILGGPLPLNALQLIWVNIASDPIVSWLLANDTPASGILNRTPRQQKESVFSGNLGRKIINRGLAMGLGAFAVYRESLGSGDSLQTTRTKTMAALGVGRFLHLLDCCRENRRPNQELGINKSVKLGGGVILASLAGAMYVPFVRAILNTAPLGLQQWLPVFVWSGLGAVADRGLGFLTKQVKNPPGKSRKA